MFAASGRRTTGSNPNRWLLLAGAGLLALGVVLRLMMDIGRTTASAADDAVAAPDSAPGQAAPAPSANLAAAALTDSGGVPPDSTTPKALPAAAGTPVSPPPTQPPPVSLAPAAPPVATEPGAGAWVVQLGVFGSPDNAKRVVSEARRLGFAVEAVPVGPAGRVRVRTSGHASRDAAQVAADSLSRHLRLNAVVLKP